MERERLERNRKAIEATTEEVAQKLDRLIEIFKAQREGEKKKVSPEFIEKVTELVRPTLPVRSEKRVRKIIRQEFMKDRVKKLASRYHRG